MQLSISGHHVDVTDALKSYVEEKLKKLERHYRDMLGAKTDDGSSRREEPFQGFY